MRWHMPFLVGFGVIQVVAALGCNQGYQSAAELEHAERGPSHCAQSCQELGLRMSAFVLVESNVAGCVCAPRSAVGAADVEGDAVSSAAAAGYVVVDARRRAAASSQAHRPPAAPAR
jgi:hypothetical protein